MIELIIVIFKNLLKIPISKSHSDYAFTLLLIQKFSEDGVFDSFVYITQNFKTELNKKLIFHFLDIYYSLFKDYCPMDLCNVSNVNGKIQAPKRQTLKDFMNSDRKAEQKRREQMSSRHSRFGTKVAVLNRSGVKTGVLPAIMPTSSIKPKHKNLKSAPKRKGKVTDEPKGMRIHFRQPSIMNAAISSEEEKVKLSLNKL